MKSCYSVACLPIISGCVVSTFGSAAFLHCFISGTLESLASVAIAFIFVFVSGSSHLLHVFHFRLIVLVSRPRR